ncbi:MAG: radical SAM protein, partial [Thermoleophilia bacterium]|nr:radical SAM protein [Thermoleophilia bacterium]
DDETAGWLHVQEVQISLDGMEDAHDYIRGQGTFQRSVAAIRRLTAAGKQVSVATMVHSRNLADFNSLAGLIRELGVREWAVDLPSAAGRLEHETGLMVDPRTAGPFLNYSFGGAIHEPIPGYACGAHLMAVMANGDAARCGFYAGEPVGTISEGLAACWQKVRKLPLSELECDCEFLEDCRGGCRFRASGYNKPESADLCQCYRYGVIK